MPRNIVKRSYVYCKASCANRVPSIQKVLQHMTDRDNKWTTDTASGAMILLRQTDYEFVCLLEMWSEVLVKLYCTNKSLQRKSATLDVASSLLSGYAKTFNICVMKAFINAQPKPKMSEIQCPSKAVSRLKD
ncbi:hypothetical protein AVEN_111447-1 [Araneus ventricosus]|uniref:Uncharacterized protein n=1 Tax=Araneus ventricosus TaxID=182803 RepID=A0A4Y2K053_ARAVE|nr:hypothetical protein AVEN_111447-1 [Araneus ventricosus]